MAPLVAEHAVQTIFADSLLRFCDLQGLCEYLALENERTTYQWNCHKTMSWAYESFPICTVSVLTDCHQETPNNNRSRDIT